jgi:hypothetical protein
MELPMSNIAPALLSSAVMIVLGATVAPAPVHADQARTFVSAATGNDGGAPGSGTNVDCLRLSPCKTFTQAAVHTLANGEITVLDPGSYGAVTITQNISIINDGVGEAGILVSGGNTGIIVNAPGAAVTLRGLTIKGIGFGGGNGIGVIAAAVLNIENCTIRNLDGNTLGNGIIVQPTSGTVALTMADTTITDNAASAIMVIPSGTGSVSGSLKGVGVHSNGFAGLAVDGVSTSGTLHFAVTDSAATNNGFGFLALTGNGAGGVTELHVERSVAANNVNTGVVALNLGATVHISDSVVVGNAIGLQAANGGQIFTFGDNLVSDNTSSPGPLTPASKN